VTLQELRHLAVDVAVNSTPPTPAQRILGQYHAAYLDLQAATLGLSAADADRTPAESEWPVRKVYAHILGAEFGFRAVIRYALEGHRAGTWTPDRIPEDAYPRLYGLSEAEYHSLMDGSFENMLAFHRALHPSILAEFSSITDGELDQPSTFWEETRFPIRHRLHRSEAHITQHTIQIDKTLVAIGLSPNESKCLIRKVYAALAEAESEMLGVDGVSPEINTLAKIISQRTDEIRKILE
jgi:hypothetical protein